MQKVFLILTIFTLFLLAACSKNPYDGYTGLWERQDVKRYEVIEILKQGDSLLLNNAVLSSSASNESGGNLMVLGKAEGQLVFDSGLGNVHLVLSDTNTLRIGKERFSRISADRLTEIKAAIALEEQEKLNMRLKAQEKLEQERLEHEAKKREQALQRVACQELLDQINVEIASIKQYASNNKKWSEEYEKIKQKYTETAKDYVNCRPDFF